MNAAANDISRFYDRWMRWPVWQEYYGHSGFFNVGYWLPDTYNQTEACENLIEKLLGFLPATRGTILDIACGLGATTRHLLKHYPASDVIGINISGSQLRQCRLNIPPCRFLQMDAARLGFGDATFDTIICVEAAFHFNTRLQFLHEAYRVLKPGGFLLLSDMFFAPPLTLDRAILPEANHIDNVDTYTKLYVQVGFQPVHVTDATEQSWSAFRQHVLRWAQGMAFVGAISDQVFRSLVHNFPGFDVSHYLLVAARKFSPALVDQAGAPDGSH